VHYGSKVTDYSTDVLRNKIVAASKAADPSRLAPPFTVWTLSGRFRLRVKSDDSRGGALKWPSDPLGAARAADRDGIYL
jgi:hypothetical protein